MTEKKPTMLDYIDETPATVLANIDQSQTLTKALVDLYCAKEYEGVCVVASGSSYNGSLCARSFFRHYLKAEMKLITPFTFANHEHDLREKLLTVCISQSGCSTNTIECLKLMKANGEHTIAIVGRDDCDMKEDADTLINWGVGVEKVGFVTKGVVSLAAFWMLFTLEVCLRKGVLKEDEYGRIKEDMRKAMRIHPQLVQETKDKFALNYKAFTSMDKLYVLGSGPNYGTVVEGALKISETACIPCLPIEAEEYLHGYNIQLDPTYPVLLMDNGKDKSSERIVNIYKATRIITDKTFIISNSPEVENCYAFRTTEETCPLISPLYKLAVIQTLAYLITEETSHWYTHPLYAKFKDNDLVKSKSRTNLYSL